MVWGAVLALGGGCGSSTDVLPPYAGVHEVRPVDLSAVSVIRPATMMATLPTTLPVTRVESEVTLSVQDVRGAALENNLGLKVELFNPTIARQAISEEEARFEAMFTTDVAFAVLDQPTSSELNSTEVNDVRVTPGLTVPLRTGGSIRLSAPLERSETNNQFNTVQGPVYTSDAAVTLSQPLLRGAGRDVAEYGIRVAAVQHRQAEARTKLEITRVLAEADRVYWRLYAARQELLVRKQEYDLAVAQLDRARRQARAGVVAEVDVVRAESGVADKLEAIIVAENAVRDRERDLKRIMNRPGLEMEGTTVVVPGTEPRELYFRVDVPKLTDQAMAGRMELLETELEIARQTLAVGLARNEMLPLVALEYTYNINGLGRNLHDSFEQVRRKNFEDNIVGVRVEVPIGNEAARSRLRRALASRQQQLATREQRVLQVKQELFNAVDQLEANWQRTLAARKRVELAARVLEVEIRQFNLGLRTSTDVLIAESNLANAKSAEISAVTEYQIAQVDIAFATGTVLGQARVEWREPKVRQ